MSDSQNDAVFNEVLSLRVDYSTFADDMDRVAEIYSEKLKSMPNLDIGGASAAADSVNNLTSTLEKLGSNATGILDDLSKAMVDTSDSIAADVTKIGDAVEANLAKITELASAVRKAGSAAGGSSESSGSSWGNELIEGLPRVATFYAEWQLVGAAIGAVTEGIGLIKKLLVDEPFDVVKGGFDYLAQFQQRSGELKSALIDSERFSSDIGENFKIAGQEADRLTHAIDQMAAKLGVQSQTVQTAFQSFLAAGGANVVANNDQGVQLSGILTAAMQSVSPTTNARQMVTQIQQLVEGTLPATSRLATALGLSTEQLKQMVDHAKTHKDLLEEIIAAAPGLTERLSEADQRQVSLSAALEDYKQRWEALVAGPLFERFIEWMQEGLRYLNEHDTQLRQIGVSLGIMVDKAAQVVESFAKSDLSGMKQTMQELASWAVIFAREIGIAVNDFTHFMEQRNLNSQKTLGDVLAPFPTEHGDRINDQKDKVENDRQNQEANIRQAAQDALDLINGKTSASDVEQKKLDDLKLSYEADLISYADYQKRKKAIEDQFNGTSTGAAYTPTHGIPQKDNGQALADLKEYYDEQLKLIQEFENKYRNSIEESQHAGIMSVQDALDKKAASYHQEANLIQQLTDKIKEQASALGLKPQQLDSLDKTLFNANQSATKQADNADTKAHDNAFDEAKKANQNTADAVLKIKNAALDAQLERVKAAEKAGVETHLQAAQDEIAIDDKKFQNEVEHLEMLADIAGRNSEQGKKYLDEEASLRAQHDAQAQANAEKLRQAREADFQRELQHAQTMAQLRVQGAQENLTGAQQHGSEADVHQAQIAVQQAQTDQAGTELDNLRKQLANLANDGLPHTQEQFEELIQRIAVANQHYDDMNLQLQRMKTGWANTGTGFVNQIFGQGNAQEAVTGTDAKGNSVDGLTRFGAAIGAAADAVNTFGSALNAIENGMKQGGVLGGIGAGISSFAGAMQDVPVVGPYMGAIGSAISMIGSLFTKAAQDIANSIEKSLSTIMQQYQVQDTTMYQTIQALEQERTQAIAQLSGKKGGQDQLDKILPQIDQEIASLKLQQQQIGQSFQESLAYLQAGSGPLASWEQSWVGIMEQVKAYKDAMGTAASAANIQAFLTLQLAQQRKTLQDSYNQSEVSAIQDAINLNNLLTQRNELERQYNQQKFDLLNADSLERRESGAVSTAVQLAQLNDTQGQQLQDIDAQIAALQPKVAIEQQVFGIASDTATLEQEQNKLNLEALQEQVEGWTQIQQILQATANLTPAGGSFGLGNFLGIPGIGPLPGVDNSGQVTIGDINVTVAAPAVNGKQIGNDIAGTILGRLRSGMSQY